MWSNMQDAQCRRASQGVQHSVFDSGQSDCHTILGGETAKLKTMVADPISHDTWG